MKLAPFAAAVTIAVTATTGSAFASDILGAGATAPYPVYAKWAEAYKAETGVGLNYQSIGSGGGIKQIIANTVIFGATDKAMTPADLDKNGLVQFPTVIISVVPVVKLTGIEAGKLVLDGPTLANIFLGTITQWNDPAIAKLNPGLKLPDEAIAVVHRSDGSGTTYNFAYYLGQVSPDWAQKVGADTAVQWPVGLGAKGNEGVAGGVGNTDGAIGYVEYAYAKQNHMTTVAMVNKDGKVVQPSAEAFQAAASKADWDHAAGFGLVLANEPGEKSWPITAATFILIHKAPTDAAAAAEALKYFNWAYAKGGKIAADLDYVTLPDSVVARIRTEWLKVQADGKPVFTAK